MKSERRHDLSENYLAKWIASTFEKIAPYQNAIYWTIITVLVVVCLVMVWTNFAEKSRSKAWSDYLPDLNSEGVEKLETLMDKYTSGEVAARIRVSAGEFLLADGCQLVFSNREEAPGKLEKALGFFLAAEGMVSDNTDLAEQVAYDLAVTHETLAVVRTGQDDLAGAKGYYEKIVTRWPNGVYAKSAKKKLAYLQSDAAKRFYDYFALAAEKAPVETKSPIDINIDPTAPLEMPSDMNLDEKLDTSSDVEEPTKE